MKTWAASGRSARLPVHMPPAISATRARPAKDSYRNKFPNWLGRRPARAASYTLTNPKMRARSKRRSIVSGSRDTRCSRESDTCLARNISNNDAERARCQTGFTTCASRLHTAFTRSRYDEGGVKLIATMNDQRSKDKTRDLKGKGP